MPTVSLRRPETDEELWEFVQTVWGFAIPRTPICPHHVPPFTAFADAYFARSPVAVWKASRGFGGKSVLLALLAVTEQVCLDASVSVLGGSLQQSARVVQTMTAAWNAPLAPRTLLASEPGRHEIRLTNGAACVALMASQASVRGAHPPRLRIDEADEVELPILDAALGQPMTQKGITPHTVLSSTHQHADGTMTELIRRASQKGWPLFEWCWRETQEPHGWLSAVDIARKKLELTDSMWSVEIDLQEPAAEGRAIMPEMVAAMFTPALGRFAGTDGEYVELEKAQPNAVYATGADWGRKSHWTAIVTFRMDCDPIRLVAFERMQRRPWPDMVARFDRRLEHFPGYGGHDATGLGDVVDSLIEHEAEPVILVGRPRQDLFSEYVAGIERQEVASPMIDSMYAEHRYCTVDDLYGNGHPPDTLVAAALAWRGRLQGTGTPGVVAGERTTGMERINWKEAP